MDFAFSSEQLAFVEEVRCFIEEHKSPEVMDLTREGIAQLVDTPARRLFMKKLSEKGWLGLTWPKEYNGSDVDGMYEYLLNEMLASVGAPQIGKGVGIVGKTLIRHGSKKLKREFLPKILNAEIEFAIGYSEPTAGSDAAAMRLKATRLGDYWHFNGQKTFSTSAHFADWYWVGARTDFDAPKHEGISLFVMKMDSPGLEVHAMPTMGGERTNMVFFDDVKLHDDYRVGELNKGFQYISEALDLERFTLFTFTPIKQRVLQLVDYVKNATVDGKPLRADPLVRQRIATLVTECEVARLLAMNFLSAAINGGKPPTAEASSYKLYSTELSQRVADAMLDIAGPGSQLTLGQSGAPMGGRGANSYMASVVDTIGGGSSEVQKNIIARRKLGLPKNF
jgi:alkylation response protein AidB-like acyl-CoA dehydrogenase